MNRRSFLKWFGLAPAAPIVVSASTAKLFQKMGEKKIEAECSCRWLSDPEPPWDSMVMVYDSITLHFDPACPIHGHRSSKKYPCGVHECEHPDCPAR